MGLENPDAGRLLENIIPRPWNMHWNFNFKFVSRWSNFTFSTKISTSKQYIVPGSMLQHKTQFPVKLGNATSRALPVIAHQGSQLPTQTTQGSIELWHGLIIAPYIKIAWCNHSSLRNFDGDLGLSPWFEFMAWGRNYVPNKLWDGIIYQCSNLKEIVPVK